MQAPSPSTGDQIDLAKTKGSLLHITCHENVHLPVTKFGPADAVRADIAILDGNDKGTVLNDVLLFGALGRSLRRSVGSVDPVVLGRLNQGVANGAQDPPWILDAPTDADFATGVKYEAYVASQREAQEAF